MFSSICILLFVFTSRGLSTKPTLTLDEFFTYNEITYLTMAPDNSQEVLVQTRHHIWNRNTIEHHLYLHSIDGKIQKLIANHSSNEIQPIWRGEWIAYLNADALKTIHLYSTRSQETLSIVIGNESVHAFTWSNRNYTLYFATRTPWSEETQKAYYEEWNDAIEYRDKERGDTIYRLKFDDENHFEIETLAQISLKVAELACSLDENYLIFSTESPLESVETMEDYEVYMIDLTDSSSATPHVLTHNKAIERDLKWIDNETFLFTVTGEGSIDGEYRDTQGRLYSFDLHTGTIHRWAAQFNGSIEKYSLLYGSQTSVIILGLLNTEIQMYMQESMDSPLRKLTGWNGTYHFVATSYTNDKSTIAFIHSSIDVPQEIYVTDNIDRLTFGKTLTNYNQLFRERNLPKGKTYKWLNQDDEVEIEGILLYPPDKFQQKNLPLLVLIHGGPDDADLDVFHADWYATSIIMATDGWLVLQPNYRGSIGYGDDFMDGVRFEMLSRPGRDILFGVDALIRDGIADPKRLTIGGYSYGGYLTNWLITQTTRFNAAFTGAGAIENVIDWGANDIPLTNTYILGGLPWEKPTRYQSEAAVFQIDKVKTPTHIVTGEVDIRVPTVESYLLERSLRTLGIPTKLIVFPGEGHDLTNNPWHEKIKVREELKWLRRYGHTCVLTCEEPLIVPRHP